jgi:hypothetical protein
MSRSRRECDRNMVGGFYYQMSQRGSDLTIAFLGWLGRGYYHNNDNRTGGQLWMLNTQDFAGILL